MTSRKQAERYPLERSPLYRLGTGRDLARVLGVSPKQMRDLIIKRVALYNFRDEMIGEKKRSLAVPIYEMRALQERIKDLLGRIVLQDYVFSPRKGRTATSNAVRHLGAKIVVKLDVKQFYPSTSDEHVFQFFKYRLQMADDVAGRLTRLCTINGRVPFGSPLSPILCAFVHDDIFSKAAAMCELEGDTMTLWVDDVAVSGHDVRDSLVRSIRRLVAAKRLTAHRAFKARGRKGIVITGAHIGPKGPAPSNKSHLKMKSLLEELNAGGDAAHRLKLVRSAIGLSTHFLGVYGAESDERARVSERLMWLHNLRRDLEPLVAAQPAAGIVIPDDDTIPWD